MSWPARRLLAATGNRWKLAEFRRLLPGWEVVSPAELQPAERVPGQPLPGEVDETGDTFLDNALLKAVQASERTTLPVVADDSGLCVDFLAGEPGVRSARFGGPALDDEGRWRELLTRMTGVPPVLRGAHYQAVVVLALGGRVLSVHEGAVAGRLLEAPRGAGGFGYDPVFEVGALGLSMAEITPAEKDRVSHRARAFAGLSQALDGGLL